jgi:hypothetical protein
VLGADVDLADLPPAAELPQCRDEQPLHGVLHPELDSGLLQQLVDPGLVPGDGGVEQVDRSRRVGRRLAQRLRCHPGRDAAGTAVLIACSTRTSACW